MTTTLNTVVRPAAQIVTIVDLAKGSVYKRLESEGTSRHRFIFGVVEDIVSDGTTTAISTVEYDNPYGTPSIKHATYSASSELSLFPATAEEVRAKFDELEEEAYRDIEATERSLARKRETAARISAIRKIEFTPAGSQVIEADGPRKAAAPSED